MAKKLSSNSNLKYKNIAISGRPGVGRSTLFNNLKYTLSPYGWNFFSGGEWSREYAIKHSLHNPADPKHHLATVYSDKIDYEIDIAMRKKLQREEKYVVESWIAGWNMRGLPHVLKVLLICDEALRIDRIVNRDIISVQEAKDNIRKREKDNLTKWSRIYGVEPTDFWNPKYYDLIIDTYSSGPMETLGKVLDKLGYKNESVNEKK